MGGLSVDRGTALVFAAGLATGALVCAAVVHQRSRGSSKGGGGGHKGNPALARVAGSTSSPARSPARVGGLLPHQHEARMMARVDGRVKTGTAAEAAAAATEARLEREGSTGGSLGDLRDQIREEVISEHAKERASVTVRVPATSANMGPGFDCLGMALNIWSEVTISRADKFEIVYEGEGAEQVPCDASNLLVTGVRAAFAAAGKPLPLLRYHCVNRIPYARGMGSSSAAIVAGLIGGLVLAGHRLPCWGHEALLQLACCIEGHPDNVAPVIYGGCQLGIHNGDRWQSERVQLPPGIQVVLFIPDFIGKTSDARAVLGPTVTRQEAVFSIGRIAWLVNALSTGNLDNLAAGCQDALHQPQRAASVYKYLDPMINAAIAAGACAAYLSGAGPTVAAITSGASGDIFTQREAERVDKQVAEAMVAEAKRVGVNGKVYITNPVESGAYVVRAEPEFDIGIIKYQGAI